MNFERRQYACGVVCLFTDHTHNAPNKYSLSEVLPGNDFEFALIYFSKNNYKPTEIITLMQTSAPELRYAACTTAGEVTPFGLVAGEMMIILFPKEHFQFEYCHLACPEGPSMQDVISRVATMKDKITAQHDPESDQTIFAVCLLDGMSYMEEAITAALHWGLDEIPLLGGSAGDEMDFQETTLILNSEILDSRAIVLMIKSNLPTEIFKTENFVPRSEKLVVTRSDPDKRIVHELNGGPAAEIYAEVIGVDVDSLTSQSFASHPLGVRVGGEYYCRSIQKVNDDKSLTFFCAIDDGIVLTVAEPTGMARTTQDKLENIKESIGEIDFVMGFDCVLRRIDARNRQITHKISQIYQDNHVIGFNTYGEQYRSMHLNQTLTGVVFGIQKNN
ncbi:MAG: hypothetical protein COC17_03545 [Hyphomicrobiales bacterium]|nr:FIST C-terminal domain-containing protein [Hyphomicrobiales bacterium]PCH50883.1 MAG: hypothetical protein COC17_02985 [Hyphomicrobiales bacterium]PCH50980.1 MAG: hypothetical protein COC17_03545 [Hyphomicrobiales bacterium]